MRQLNDYKCDNCGRIHTIYIESTVKDVVCSSGCGGTAYKQIGTPQVKLDPISGDFPGATMKWARDREKRFEKKQRDGSE